MLQVLALVLFVVAVSIWWRYATRQKKYQAAPSVKRDAPSQYHCVEVRLGVPACEPVKRLGRARFLSGEAPRLPVSGCSEQRCACSYIHHDDRRDDERRNPYGQWANLPPGLVHERRARTERRRSQGNAFRPSIGH
jgi:hypothetical protein